MVELQVKEQDAGTVPVIRRQHSSAFRPVQAEHRVIVQQMLGTLDHVDDTTQVTWSSVHNYRCAVSVTGNTWKQPEYEDISNDSKHGDDEDEEIDVGNSYDTEIPVQSTIDYTEESATTEDNSTNSVHLPSARKLWSPVSEVNPNKKEPHLAEFGDREDPLGYNSSRKKQSFEIYPESVANKVQQNQHETYGKEQILRSTLSATHGKSIYPTVINNITENKDRFQSFGLEWRTPSSEVTSPILKSPRSIGSSSESLNSIRDVILRGRIDVHPSDLVRYRRSDPIYPTQHSESVFKTGHNVLERRRSFAEDGDLARRNPIYVRSYPIENSRNVYNRCDEFLQAHQTLTSADLPKKFPSPIYSYKTDSSDSLARSSQDMLQRSSSFGSTDLRKISNLNFESRNNSITDEDDDLSCISIGNDTVITDTSDGRESFCSTGIVTVHDGSSASDDEGPSFEETVHSIKSDDSKDAPSTEMYGCAADTPNVENTINEIVVKEVEHPRKSVVVEAKKDAVEFSTEDYALRSRVLVLLWVLLGERRLREVGYPLQPVHRLLWRAVDICCSVAGVKSAAAVPLNSNHDCGSDMSCFRDHTHRFLEVCAPTREHWKQFGWASLTVDAVVRKIYQEELMPLLRIQSLPPDIKKAATFLAQLERPTVMVANPAQITSQKSEIKHQIVAAPPKKKRGRPAKVTHKIEEGGRIERVMLWRFLLNLLEDPKNSPCIHWVQRDEGIFRILNTDWLARLWGRRHGNPKMTYEKMARAMRTYYRSKVLQPVPRLRNLPRKLVYKFNPAVIQKVAAMKLSCSTFTGRGMNYNK